jgi:DedD protein
MDPTLKKRLIGAVILIVIAAVVLPVFLSGPPPGRDASETLSLDIPPAPDRDLSQVTVPIDGDAADPDRVVTVDTTADGTATMPTLPPPATGTDQAAATPELPTAPAGEDGSTTTAPSTMPAAIPAPQTSQNQAPPVASATTGRFWVGLGSYGQSVNADRVIAAARTRGVTVDRETVTTSGRELVRLRAGPYATRAQAEQSRQLLIAAVPDAQPKIEESSPAPTADTPAPATGAPAAAGAWAVQVGAFGQEANASQLSDRLKSAGFPAYVERRGESFAVRVGPFARRTDAESRRQELKTGQKLDGLIVPHSG